MKKISKKLVVSTIRKKYTEALKWCRGGRGRYYKMMINTDNGAIWADTFLNENSWNEYHSASITSLDYVQGYLSETEAGYIDDAIRLLNSAGWEIEE